MTSKLHFLKLQQYGVITSYIFRPVLTIQNHLQKDLLEKRNESKVVSEIFFWLRKGKKN